MDFKTLQTITRTDCPTVRQFIEEFRTLIDVELMFVPIGIDYD